MSTISIELAGPDYTTRFHNDWDVCEAQGLLHVEDLDGWYGGVGTRSTSLNLFGQHGTYSSATLRSGRKLTLTLSWYKSIDRSGDSYDVFSRFASGLAWEGVHRMTVEIDGVKLYTDVTLDGEPQHQPIYKGSVDAFRVQIPLKADDPFLYAPDRVSYLRPQGAGVGLEYDLFTKMSGQGEPIIDDGIITTELDTSAGLLDIFKSGPLGAGGKAPLTITNEWSSTPGGRSLKIGAGTTRSSAAYIVSRHTPFGEWAGKFVTIKGTIHIPKASADEDANENNPPRAINVGVDHYGDAAPDWNYARSESAPNAPGTYELSTTFILPDRFDVWQGWFVRLFNGSRSQPVYWDNVSIEARPLLRADPHTSLELETNPAKVMQSFDLDQVTGEIYGGQPEVGDANGNIHKFAADGTLLGSMHLTNSGHLNEIGVEHDENDDVWIWYNWPAHPNGSVRMKWREGELDPAAEDIDPLPKYTTNTIGGYSLNGDTVCVYEDLGSYRNSRFTLFDKDDFLSGAGTPIAVLTPPRQAHAYQGHAHDDSYLYMNAGGSQDDGVGIWRYSWDGGEPDVVSTAGYGQANMSPRNEAEGIAIRNTTGDIVFGMSGGEAYQRVASIHDMDPALFDAAPPVTVIEPEPIMTYGEYIDVDEQIKNTGNATAYPQFLLVGEYPGGAGIGTGNGKGTIEFPWPITERAPLRIDSSGSAWIGATNVTSQLSKRDFERFQLRPGAGLAPEVYALQGGTGYCEVHVNSTYI